MAEYCKAKSDIRNNAGDPASSLLEITWVFNSEEEHWKTLIDFAIGLKENIPAPKLVIKEDVRFGIPISVREETDWLLSITKQPVIECVLTFKNETNTLVSSFLAEFHAPYWFFKGHEIPKKYFKQRVVFEIGDAIIAPFNNEASINLKFKQANPNKNMVEHANLWRLVMIIYEPSGFTVEITSKDNISLGSGKLASLLETNVFEDGLLEIAHAVDNMYFIARHFDFPLNKVIHLGQIIAQEKILFELRQVCDINNQIDAVEGTVSTKGKILTEIAVPIIKRVIFDDTSLLVAVAVAGQITLTDVLDNNWQKFVINKPRRIIQRSLTIPNDKFSSELVEKMLNDITDKLDEQGIDIIVSSNIDH